MLTNPDLLIMDEPDVFLDFKNLNALKNLINAHKGTLLVITHNRYLLNHCFHKILHLENMEIQEFEMCIRDRVIAIGPAKSLVAGIRAILNNAKSSALIKSSNLNSRT